MPLVETDWLGMNLNKVKIITIKVAVNRNFSKN